MSPLGTHEYSTNKSLLLNFKTLESELLEDGEMKKSSSDDFFGSNSDEDETKSTSFFNKSVEKHDNSNPSSFN